MTKTLFFPPVSRRRAAANRSRTLSCVWIETGNHRIPPACSWISLDVLIAKGVDEDPEEDDCADPRTTRTRLEPICA